MVWQTTLHEPATSYLERNPALAGLALKQRGWSQGKIVEVMGIGEGTVS